MYVLMSSKQNRPPYRAIGGLFECNWRFTRPSALTSPQFAAHLNVLADVLDNPLLFVLGILARVSDISLECRTENFRVGQGPGRCDGVTVRRQGPAFDEVELVRMRKAAAVDQGLFIDVVGVDNQRVAIPAGNRVAHEGWEIIFAVVILEINLAPGAQPLAEDRDMVVFLQDIERPEHREARNAQRMAH